MSKRKNWRKLLCCVLTASLLLGLALPASAAGGGDESSFVPLRFEEVDNSEITATAPMAGGVPFSLGNSDNEIVRVSIVLEEPSTLDAGYDTQNIARNDNAMFYRESLRHQQDRMRELIEREVLGGRTLDVVWNLTLAVNIISANVRRGDIPAIRALDGVADVVEETHLSAPTVSAGELSPRMSVAGAASGSTALRETGYTGAGTRIAVLDTGIDIDHQSFDPDAFLYSLGEDFDGQRLLDDGDIAAVLEDLNVYNSGSGLTADQLYRNPKVPFGYNYADRDAANISHLEDAEGEHGSHVAGIAAANRYVDTDGDGKYEDALETVMAAGVAPDAQIIVMKVFGKNGGSYDSDNIAAIEDAILLGADAINMSLGSNSAGFVSSTEYQDLLRDLAGQNAVLVAAVGNSAYWGEQTAHGNLYNDGVNFDTAGEPAAYGNALAVAAVQNLGRIGSRLRIGGETFMIEDPGDPAGAALLGSLDTAQTEDGTAFEYFYLPDDYIDPEDGDPFSSYAGQIRDKILISDLIPNYVTENGGKSLGIHKAAENYGAIACIMLYDLNGVKLTLQGTTATIPFATLPVSTKDLLLSTGEPGGDGAFRTGSITIMGGPRVVDDDPGYYVMSNFSSWGVPGDLTLKPEISTFGGNIYSVWGATETDPESDRYISLSGTSMAAPMVSGMTALLHQYLREEEIRVPDDMTSRALIQSLLMSAAAPMVDGESRYYSLLQQGAGLANVADAVATPVYITVDGQSDGKVKAELGDDPGRSGQYTVTFTLHNLRDEPYEYRLDSAVFTQDVAEVDGVKYHVASTRPMDAEVGFTADGGVVTVPAGGSCAVTAEIILTQKEIGRLDADYPAGAYVEAFLFAEPLPDAEGVILPTLSVPVLGFYGGWSESSMFDVGTANAHSGDTRDPYLPDSQNILVFERALDSGDSMYVYYGENPWDIEGAENARYSFDREAFNPAHDTIQNWIFSLIRNAGDSRFRILDAKDESEVLYEKDFGECYAVYYTDEWTASLQGVPLLLGPSTLASLGFKNYQKLILELTMAPEYYVDDSGTRWEELKDGARLRLPVTVDTEKPELIREIAGDPENGIIRVAGRDNQYLAAVLLCDDTGEDILDIDLPMQESPDTEYTATFEGLNKEDVYKVQIWDYAGNARTFRVFLGEVDNVSVSPAAITLSPGESRQLTARVNPESLPDRGVTWQSDAPEIASVDDDGLVRALKAGTASITAASNLDTTKQAVCRVTVRETGSSGGSTVHMPGGSIPSISPGPSTPSVSSTTTIDNFTDVSPGAWYYGAVEKIVAAGLMNGVAGDSFAPEQSLNRGMLATMLYRLADQPAAGGSAGFDDVPDGLWYSTPVTWAASGGIVSGYEDGSFRPGSAITRQELAVMLWRYARQLGLAAGAGSADLSGFTDSGRIAGWAGEAMSWAYGAGIIQGMGDGTLDPAGGATRAQAAAMLVRFMDWIESPA